MAFKMKGSAFKLGNVATKSALKQQQQSSPMKRTDIEIDGEIVTPEEYDKYLSERKVIKSVGEIPNDPDALKEMYGDEFMTKEEFESSNPNADWNAYHHYLENFTDSQDVSDQLAGVTKDVKLTGTDVASQLDKQYADYVAAGGEGKGVKGTDLRTLSMPEWLRQQEGGDDLLKQYKRSKQGKDAIIGGSLIGGTGETYGGERRTEMTGE